MNLIPHPSPPAHLTGRVVGHHLLQFFHILVTIATLVEAKSPVRWHVGPTNHLLVLLNYCLRLRTKKEVEIQDSWVEMGEEGEENLAEVAWVFRKAVG